MRRIHSPGIVSATVGVSGAAGLRFAVVTATPRTVALLDERKDEVVAPNNDLDMAGDLVVHGRRRRLVGHVGHLDAGQAFCNNSVLD